jgi:hypothetical protein
MSNMLDDRAMQKMTPEEEIAHWKGVAEYHRTRADGEERCVRERALYLMLRRSDGYELDTVIEKTDQAVQYILYGKQMPCPSPMPE